MCRAGEIREMPKRLVEKPARTSNFGEPKYRYDDIVRMDPKETR